MNKQNMIAIKICKDKISGKGKFVVTESRQGLSEVRGRSGDQLQKNMRKHFGMMEVFSDQYMVMVTQCCKFSEIIKVHIYNE